MSCGIYKIKNNINGKLYIGQSVNIEKRWKNHKCSKPLYPLYKAFEKYGIDNFTFSVICECPKSSLDEYEISYIKYYDSYNNGYNLTIGGSSGIAGYKHTSEAKLKIAHSNSVREITQSHRNNATSAQYGKKSTDITKQKMSDIRKDKPLTEKNKQNISVRRKNKTFIVDDLVFKTIIEFAKYKKIGRNAASKWLIDNDVEFVYV